jgi:hypothetical protein
MLEVNVHGCGGPRLNADQWSHLPKEVQEKWDQLDQEHKAIILEHKLQPLPGGSARGPPRHDFGKPWSGSHFVPRNHPVDTAVNLHDISVADYILNLHQINLDEAFVDNMLAVEIPPEPHPPLLYAVVCPHDQGEGYSLQ